jgi:hypothetical protein
VANLQVQPRPTPEERAQGLVDVEVDEDLTVFISTLEDWAANRPAFELLLYEGHDFGRTNNVEVSLLFASREQTSTLTFRLDQLESAEDTGEELVLRFEERDGIAKLARLRPNGLDVELFHILTFT